MELKGGAELSTIKACINQQTRCTGTKLWQTLLLYTDASQKSLGCILMQPGDDDKAACHVTAYATTKLLPRERRHSTVELELAAICFGLNKFQPLKLFQNYFSDIEHFGKYGRRLK